VLGVPHRACQRLAHPHDHADEPRVRVPRVRLHAPRAQGERPQVPALPRADRHGGAGARGRLDAEAVGGRDQGQAQDAQPELAAPQQQAGVMMLAEESDRAKRASGAYWGASGAPLFGAGERGRIKNIRGRCSMRRGILYSTAAPDIFYSASFARKPGSPVSERREGQLPAETIGQFLPSAWRYPHRCVCIEV